MKEKKPKENDDYYIILNSNRFDKKWYINKYSLNKEIDPIIHYLEFGVKNNLNPSENFDTSWYLDENPDVKRSGINPFVHYIKYGIYEGRIPKILTLKEIEKQNLKLSLRGKKSYLFLINDSNNEIKQHFDPDYENQFNSESFIKSYYFKKEVFNSNNIDYFFFVVPDKSIICKDYLPFEYETLKRNVDKIDEIPDFSNDLTPNNYYKHDSHLNYSGGKILSFKFLNYINNLFTLEDYNKLIKNGEEIIIRQICDLLAEINYSYPLDERKNLFTDDTEKAFKAKNLEENKIPEKFSFFNKRESKYFKNPNSFTDLKVLIFHDSSFKQLMWYFTLYFNEMFLFWDHGTLNKELISWYKPDVIIEIRVERFLENLIVPTWIKNKENLND